MQHVFLWVPTSLRRLERHPARPIRCNLALAQVSKAMQGLQSTRHSNSTHQGARAAVSSIHSAAAILGGLLRQSCLSWCGLDATR